MAAMVANRWQDILVHRLIVHCHGHHTWFRLQDVMTGVIHSCKIPQIREEEEKRKISSAHTVRSLKQ